MAPDDTKVEAAQQQLAGADTPDPRDAEIAQLKQDLRHRDGQLQAKDDQIAKTREVAARALDQSSEVQQQLRDKHAAVEPSPESCGMTARAKKPGHVESITDPTHPVSWGGGGV